MGLPLHYVSRPSEFLSPRRLQKRINLRANSLRIAENILILRVRYGVMGVTDDGLHSCQGLAKRKTSFTKCPRWRDGWPLGTKAGNTRLRTGRRTHDMPQRILEAKPRALTQGAMRRSVLFAFVLSVCLVWLPTARSASDKKHDPESVLVSVEGCLKMSVTEYVIIDDTGTEHNLIGSTTKLSHYVGHRVQIIGEPTIKTIDTTQANIASSVDEVSAIRVLSGRQVGGRCDR